MERLHTGPAGGRLDPAAYESNFSDLHPRFGKHEALVASDRCYFCHDAPCMTACPTSIDIPLFIRQISTGNEIPAAKTILEQNIFGGMCARVCPTETLCEQACVRNTAEEKPVDIGRLQRFATDAAMDAGRQFFKRAAPTGKKVAVVGAGPAGLACAHRLALKGHDVTVFDARQKAGGLNEYGLATYKASDNFAAREIAYILEIGGITMATGKSLGVDFTLESLRADFDAVFLGIGLADTNALGIEGEELDGVEDAVDFIAGLRQATNKADVPVGRRVVVLGGGMTAVDAAIQSKLLGAEDVTICYRRGQAEMNASEFEQELAASKGVFIRHWMKPKTIIGDNGKVVGIEMEYTEMRDGRLVGTGESGLIPADHVLKAIGQKLVPAGLEGLALEAGRIVADESGKTSMPKVWAGGDCVAAGEDLTVTAVAQGRDAAESIHCALTGV